MKRKTSKCTVQALLVSFGVGARVSRLLCHAIVLLQKPTSALVQGLAVQRFGFGVLTSTNDKDCRAFLIQEATETRCARHQVLEVSRLLVLKPEPLKPKPLLVS